MITATANHFYQKHVSVSAMLICFGVSYLLFLLSPRLCPSIAGCSPPSMPSIAFCLLLSCSRWLPPSLLCRLAIFCLVVPLISSLPLVATLGSVFPVYCPSFLLYARPSSIFSVCILQCHSSLLFFLIKEHGTLSCIFKFNIVLSIAL